MFTVSGISNSIIAKALYNNNGEASSTDNADTSSQVSDLSATDIVTLSSESMDLLEEIINSADYGASSSASSDSTIDLLNALCNSTSDGTSSDESSGSQGLLNALLNSTLDGSDDSTGALYDILVSAQNTRLIKNNPDLVNMILAARDMDSTDNSSLTLETDDINLLAMSADEILNAIEKYKEYSSISSTGSASLLDETV